ncbi:MAG: DUF1571 domain-containing protein [Planctomycetes bacterium]|nr:DUF1571 domain-containing protein [Planctomycetota bacterium]
MDARCFRKVVGIAIATAILVGVIPLASAQSTDKGKVIPAAVKQTELDVPLQWMHEAKRNYTAVKDYTCTLITQENVKGKLQETSYISLKIKTEPFSVYMRWIGDTKSAGQEVAFALGKNNNKMRVKSNIIKGVLGWHSIDVNDKRVMEHSRHTILEAGIGNMIEQCIAQWEKDRVVGKTKVNVSAASFNNRVCHKVELTRLERDPAFYCFRTVIYLEKESKLPIRLENYDWPRPGGPVGGETLEQFSYINILWNTGLKDAEFVK